MTTPDIRRRRPDIPVADDAEAGQLVDDDPASAGDVTSSVGGVLRADPAGNRGAKAPVNRVVRRRVRVVAGSVVVALVAFLVISGLQAHGQLDRSSRAFASTRAEERATLDQLARTEASLASVLSQSAAANQTLGSVNGQLAAERNQLSQQQKNLFIQGVSISALDTCLGGVESALNEVALNDQSGAASTLQSVSSSCRTAGASSG